MKKILLCIDSLTGGGAERATILLASHLAKKNVHVCIVTLYGEERDFYSVPAGVKRYALGLMQHNRGIAKLSANFRRISAIRSAVKYESADVVIGMMTTCSVLSAVACLGLSTCSITAERNYPGRKQAIKPWGLMRKIFYRFADAHIVQSKETAVWLKKNTGARNSFVIPNAVSWPLENLSPVVTPESLVNADAKLILAVGTKPGQKGFDLLLKAFASVADQAPNWKLAIAGIDVTSPASEEVSVLLELANNLGLTDNIVWPGRIGNVADWYERADMFVLSSRYEGFPNVLLEAMSAGCPSIAFDCDTGPRDIIRDGENGLLVAPESTEKLAEAMLTLVQDGDFRKKLSASAVAVREDFAEDKIFREWERVINEVL